MGITSSGHYNKKIAELFTNKTNRSWKAQPFDQNKPYFDGFFWDKGIKITFQIVEGSLYDEDIKDKLRRGMRVKVGTGSNPLINFYPNRVLYSIKEKSSKSNKADILLVVVHCFNVSVSNFSLKYIDFFKEFKDKNQMFLNKTSFKEVWLLSIRIPNCEEKELVENLTLEESFQLK